jgi:hypothetical protein
MTSFPPSMDFWMTVRLMVARCALAAAAGVAQLAAWVGALVNAYQLEDKIWFYALLGGGVFGVASGLIPFASMIAYLIAGPDGSLAPSPRDVVPPTSLSVPAMDG